MFEWFSWHSFTSNVISFRAIIASTTAAPDAGGRHGDGRAKSNFLIFQLGTFWKGPCQNSCSLQLASLDFSVIFLDFSVFFFFWKSVLKRMCRAGETNTLLPPATAATGSQPNKTCDWARNRPAPSWAKFDQSGEIVSGIIASQDLEKKPLKYGNWLWAPNKT